jgi:SAM-dependent methyltransferase
MVRYYLAAMALKALSISPSSRRLYRRMGNTYGAKRRANADISAYRSRGQLLVDLWEKYATVRPDDRLLEVGTGWMHWFALFMRLHYDVHIKMVDVWDNRQFMALQSGFGRLEDEWPDAKPPLVAANLRRLRSASTFEELYDRFDLEYVVDPRGDLSRFPDRSFNGVFSFHVLEHLDRNGIPRFLENMARVLAPGEISIHQIGIDDHLAHYDTSASAKQYLAYSDATWRRRFENRLQYINRVQLSEWLALFERYGFRFREKIIESTTIDGLEIDPRWAGYSLEDKTCTIATIVHERD